MSDQDDLTPQTDDELESVDELGGDADIMESLPDEGSPIETDYASNGDGDDEPSDEALEEVDALGGDADIMESLPDEGSPIESAIDYEGYQPSDDEPPLTQAEIRAAYERVSAGEDYTPPSGDSYTDFLDIEAALASVATLSDVMAEREAAEQAEINRARDLQVAKEQAAARRAKQLIAVPPPFAMRRGQPASVVPALLLIGVGAVLTLALSGVVAISPVLAGVALIGVLAVSLLAYWLTTGRWSRGALFFGVITLGVAAAILYTTITPQNAGLLPVLLVFAAAVAFILTGVMARPAERRLVLPGVVIAALGVIALVIALGVVPQTLVASVTPLWPVLVAALAIVWLLPVLKRRG